MSLKVLQMVQRTANAYKLHNPSGMGRFGDFCDFIAVRCDKLFWKNTQHEIQGHYQ